MATLPTLLFQRLPAAVGAAAVAVCAFCLAALAVMLTREADGVAPLWPVNAVWLIALIRAPRPRWAFLLSAGTTGNFAAYLVFGDPAGQALGLSFCNALEVLIAAWGLTRSAGAAVDLGRRYDLVQFVLFSLLGSVIGTVLSLAWLPVMTLQEVATAFTVRTLAHALGFTVLVPALLALSSGQAAVLPRRPGLADLACALLLAGVLAGVFTQTRYPLLFAVPPVLLLLAFRYEMAGAALGVLVTGLVAIAATAAGFGPTALMPVPLTERMLILQVFLAVSTAASFPVAAVLAHRRALRASAAQALEDAVEAHALAKAAQLRAEFAERVAGVGYWRADLDSGVMIWSDELKRIANLDDDAPQTIEALSQALHPDDRAASRDRLQRLREDGQDYTAEARILLPSGATRMVEIRTVAERDAKGAVTVIFGTMADITERKAAQQQIADSERRYRLLADNATDIIARYTPGGTFTYLSDVVEGVLGRSPDSLIGRTTAEIVHPDDLPGVLDAFRAYVAAGPQAPSPRIEYRALHANGDLVWLEACPRASWDENGAVVEFIDFVRDINDRKRLEAELTAARAAAEAAAHAKAEFLANMSHELRTPLTSVIGFAGLLAEQDELPPTAAHFVKRINDAGKALHAVVNDVLDFSKLESGQLELDPHPFDLDAFAAETLDLVSVQAQAKKLSLHLVREPGGASMVVQDSSRLRQVVLNLLSNAVKFTAEGEVRMIVSHSGEGAAGRLRIVVSDTGVGIPSDRRDMLFQRFSQVDGSIARAYGGTGLGLAICRGLVDLMGGRMGVESVEGQGSTFWLEAPAPADERIERPAPTAQERRSGKAAHILVVDDTSATRDLLRTVLESQGHAVSEAACGNSAVRAAMERRYDLILMDIQMPGMDGVAAAKVIREAGGLNGRTPILAVTADSQPARTARLRSEGMLEVLSKPIRPYELNAALDRWLPGRIEAEAQEGVDAA